MLWDLAFGTFHNPPEFEQSAGFYDGASARIGAMLVGRDVSAPRSGTHHAIANLVCMTRYLLGFLCSLEAT